MAAPSIESIALRAGLEDGWMRINEGCRMPASPIEQLMYAALEEVSYDLFEGGCDPVPLGDQRYWFRGPWVEPQFQIARYRVDFRCFLGIGPSEVRSIIVECDSQAYHERSEQERRYEKQRERFLVSSGFRVLRFTGKEILLHPRACATEVWECLRQGAMDGKAIR